jgi:hypothetical protein
MQLEVDGLGVMAQVGDALLSEALSLGMRHIFESSLNH